MIHGQVKHVIWRLVALSLLVILVAGCASPARVEGMVARGASVEAEVPVALRESIRVTSVIGGDKSPLDIGD